MSGQRENSTMPITITVDSEWLSSSEDCLTIGGYFISKRKSLKKSIVKIEKKNFCRYIFDSLALFLKQFNFSFYLLCHFSQFVYFAGSSTIK